MKKIRTEFEFEAAHSLELNYASPCTRLHGHSYRCAVTLTSAKLNKNGMIIDFKELKAIIRDVVEEQLDHKNMNDIFPEVNVTAEFLSEWIGEQVNDYLKSMKSTARCICVEVNETSKNRAIWEED